MIPIRIRFFAILREITGYEMMNHECRSDRPVAPTCGEVLAFLKNEFPLAKILDQSRLAVNGEFAKAETQLRAGDELSILPPVSGG